MPKSTIEQLSDRSSIPLVGQKSFAGGMRDRDHPSELSEVEYARGVDIENRDSAIAKTRRGRTVKTDSAGIDPQGAIFFQPNGGTAVIFQVNSGIFWTWANSGTAWTRVGLTQLTNTTEPVMLVILNGTLYVFSGTGDNVYSWDGIAANFTNEGNTNSDPGRGDIVCQQEGRLAVAGLGGIIQDYIEFSDIFGGGAFDRAANNKRVPTNGSEPVTALASYRNSDILAWTTHSTHIFTVSGSTVSSFTRQSIDPEIGCAAKKSVVVVGEDAFFVSADKQVRTIKRTVQDKAFGVTIPITYLVPNLMDRINGDYLSLCAGCYFDNYYLLAVPFDTETRNSGVIAFDMLHQMPTPAGQVPVCVGEWTNMCVCEWVVTEFDGVTQLHYIDSNDGKAYLMFDGTSDDGENITSIIDFRSFDWGISTNDKTAHSGELQFLDTTGTATLSYAKDDGIFNTLLAKNVGDPSIANLPINLPFVLPGNDGVGFMLLTFYGLGRSRYWQLRLTFTNGTFNLKQLFLRAHIESIRTR